MNNIQKKILIVDDQEISLKLLEHIISAKYTPVCALSGEEALQKYEEEGPDLVLSDLRMPGMSGFELQLTLQGKYHEQIPFIFMTADSDEAVESIGFKNGALDFIRKPFNADALMTRIDNILNTLEKIRGLTRAAVTDPMTGLLNKASARNEIATLCAESPGALLMIDLDSFKLVNDLYGHSMGDRILIDFSNIIRSAVRSSDLVGRMGGDEFIAFCQHVTDEEVIAAKTAYINDSLLSAAKLSMGLDMNIPLGASIGCVFAPAEGTDFDVLFHKADKALYRVKQNGKHGYAVFHADNSAESSDEGSHRGIDEIAAGLSERHRERGAMLLNYERFRDIYRFLSRTVHNYHRNVWLLSFKLKAKSDSAPALSDAEAQLCESIVGSLRLSDVACEPSGGRVNVLLLEAPRGCVGVVTERVYNKWAAAKAAAAYELSHEIKEVE